jgi:hypothetical protein
MLNRKIIETLQYEDERRSRITPPIPLLINYKCFIEFGGIDDNFTTEEINILEEMIEDEISNKEYSLYYALSEYVDFILKYSYCFSGDNKDGLIYDVGYEILINNKTTDTIDPNVYYGKESDLHKWFATGEGKLSFFEEYYKYEHFEKMNPHYVQSIKELINEKLEKRKNTTPQSINLSHQN